jgi:hypothetical protein
VLWRLHGYSLHRNDFPYSSVFIFGYVCVGVQCYLQPYTRLCCISVSRSLLSVAALLLRRYEDVYYVMGTLWIEDIMSFYVFLCLLLVSSAILYFSRSPKMGVPCVEAMRRFLVLY